jgi:hypothetical protein
MLYKKSVKWKIIMMDQALAAIQQSDVVAQLVCLYSSGCLPRTR